METAFDPLCFQRFPRPNIVTTLAEFLAGCLADYSRGSVWASMVPNFYLDLNFRLELVERDSVKVEVELAADLVGAVEPVDGFHEVVRD